MKRSEVLDYAMRGVIELMRQEQNEKVNAELNQALKELALMFVLAEQNEREQGYLSYLRKGPLKRPLGGLKAIWGQPHRPNFEKRNFFGIICMKGKTSY